MEKKIKGSEAKIEVLENASQSVRSIDSDDTFLRLPITSEQGQDAEMANFLYAREFSIMGRKPKADEGEMTGFVAMHNSEVVPIGLFLAFTAEEGRGIAASLLEMCKQLDAHNGVKTTN